MIITEFDSFNEGFLGVDLKKIKDEARKFSKSRECVKIFSKVDVNILNSAVKEFKSLNKKWGSIDDLGQKILKKVETSNEGVGSIIVLSMFGIHAFMKLLSALKNNQSFLEYFKRLFMSNHAFSSVQAVKTTRDIIIMIIFLLYTIFYISQSYSYSGSFLQTTTGQLTKLIYKWNGIHDYVYVDAKGKKYDIKKLSGGIIEEEIYGIFYKGSKIGTTDMESIFKLDGSKLMDHVSFGEETPDESIIIDFQLDLEKFLKGNFDKEKKNRNLKEIDIRKKEIDRLKHEVDSLNSNVYESVDMARKVFKEVGKDYDSIINNREALDSKDGLLIDIRDTLVKSNNLGYLGLFANLIINSGLRREYLGPRLFDLYDRIKRDKDILNKIRNNNGEICSIFDFKKYEDIIDAFNRLEDWRKVNHFMRQIPINQKRLIWKDGYYVDDLKGKSQFLTSSIIKISENPDLSRSFLSKISALKTKETIIDSIIRITDQKPWDFDYWKRRLDNTRNVYVTWSSKEKNQIICIVTSYATIQKIAYMTNWCITRERRYFNQYSRNGFQCILYDFNHPITSNSCVIGFSLNDENEQYRVTDCHNKSDKTTILPEDFIIMKSEHRWVGRASVSYIKPEFVKVDLTKAAMKFDNTFLKILKQSFIKPIRNTLNKPIISKFIDFYDED